MTFSFGQSDNERIEIDVLRYERNPIGDYHDDNWLVTETRACVGGFRCKVGASVLTDELVRFLPQLRSLFETLRGSAEFLTLEGQLRLHLVGDGKGNIEMRGELADRPGDGNRLHFNLQFDQSQLGESISELEKVISEFPVRSV